MDDSAEMVDGLPSENRQCLHGATLLEQVENAWRFTGGRHEETLKRIAKMMASELTVWLRWLNNLAAQKGVRLDVVLTDSPDYGARVKWIPSQYRYQIQISLGTVPTLLYIAPIVDLSLRGTTMFYGRIEESVRSLKETGFPNASITSNGENLVVGAVTMMFLHEVGHAFGGHLMWPDLRRDEISYRAAETDADWGAGRMFAIGLLEQRTAANDIARRVVGSAAINHIALEITLQQRRVPTTKYHLPQQRLIANIQGANSAWQTFGIKPDAFREAVGRCDMNLAWMYTMFAEQFRRKDDSEEWFYDEDVQADRMAYDQITVPRILELRTAMFDSRIAPM